MLKNLLHASASQVSMFRLITGVPLYLGFAFGLVRDSWSPFGGRDPGYFRIFVPLMMLVLGWVALSPTTYIGLLFGMLLALISYGFLSAAFQGLLALVGQESLMPGRLSTLMNFSLNITIIAGAFASGWISAHLSPRQTFLLVLALTAPLGVFGFWRPRSVFVHAYDNPHARGTNFLGDLKRLVKHRARLPGHPDQPAVELYPRVLHAHAVLPYQ